MRLYWLLLLIFAHSTQAVLRFKLQQWFPTYEDHWTEAAASCHQELHYYFTDNRTDCRSPCACAADCILQNVTGTIQSNLASAQVLLGLMPATLGFFGPSIAEVAALSTYRPFLAVLLSLGSPAINLNRLFGHVDVREPFIRPLSKSSRLWPAFLAHQNVFWRAAVQALTYVGAFAAIANNVYNSVYTDLRTISGWRCGALFMPLVWSLLAVVVHAWGMVAVRFRMGRSGHRPSIRAAVHSSAFRRVRLADENIVSESLFWFASLCAIIHNIFGILEMSSLVFISALEALQVFAMYSLSAICCQFILLLELANMRYELSVQQDSSPEFKASSQSLLRSTLQAYCGADTSD